MNNFSNHHLPPLDIVKAFQDDNVDLRSINTARRNSEKQSSYSLSPYTGPWGNTQKKHLLNRTVLGYAKRHLSDLENLSLEQSIDLLFTPELIDEPINNYYHDFTPEEFLERYGVDDVGAGETFINRPSSQDNENGNNENGDFTRYLAINVWLYKRIYFQKTSIHWRMFYFLHNLIPSNGGGINNKAVYSYYKLLFDAAFGSYKDTIYNYTINPATLVFLNLGQSKKETPDENYAREIQELFTVGKRPFSNFTESDVREAARLLVGWYVNKNTIFEEGPIVSGFNPNNHDTGDKQFSAFYDDKLISGGTDASSGEKELKEFINMLFDTQEAAVYLSRRLYQFFVYPDLTEAVEENVIPQLAEVMRNNNYSLTETLKVLLSSEHFFDNTLYNSMIKSPVEFLFGLTKEFDLFNGKFSTPKSNKGENFEVPEKYANPLTRSYYFFKQFRNNLADQGYMFCAPPNASGWSAYYQKPIYDLFWINSVSLKKKLSITNAHTQWGTRLGDNIYLGMNHLTYLMTYENYNDFNALLDEMAFRLLGNPTTAKTRTRLKEAVLGSLDESYWSETINAYNTAPTPALKNVIDRRMKNLLSQLFQLGEIHLF